MLVNCCPLLRWSLYPATTRGSQLVCMPANPPVTADTKIEDFLFVKLSANSQTAAQVYSSSENWPLKPFSNTTVYNFLVQSFQFWTRCKNSELRSSLSSMTRILVRAWVRIRDHYQAGVWSASLTRHYNRTKPAVSSRNPHYAISTSFSCSKRHFRLGQK